MLHSALILLIDGVDRIFGFRHQGFEFLFVGNKLLDFILSCLKSIADLHQVYTVHAIDHHTVHIAKSQSTGCLHIEAYHRHVAHIVQNGSIERVTGGVGRLVSILSICLFSWCLRFALRFTAFLSIQSDW